MPPKTSPPAGFEFADEEPEDPVTVDTIKVPAQQPADHVACEVLRDIWTAAGRVSAKSIIILDPVEAKRLVGEGAVKVVL